MPGVTSNDAGSAAAGTPAGMNASRLLKVRTLWITPAVLGSLLIFLISLIYVGSVVDPTSHLKGLPVLVVNQDSGTSFESGHIDIGQEVASALVGSKAVTARLSLHVVTLGHATTEMNKNEAYATVIIPARFSESTLAIYTSSALSPGVPAVPTIELLTNPRSGSIGVSLATGVTQPALAAISKGIGERLSAVEPAPAGTNAAQGVLRSNPVTVSAVAFRPLPSHSALGLSAFYISLLTIMCGFLGATVVNSTLDAALGYATSEVGPKWSQRIPLRISRWQTLLAKWCMAAVLVPVLVALLLVVAAAILGMNAPHVLLLWAFTAFAAIVVASGTLVFFAAFGTLGQLLAMLVFIYLALASSGGTIPVQALPGVLRFAAGFEPLRQVLDGVRSILYFNAVGDAGLTRGFVMTTVGLAIWSVLGIAVTVWYDRRGLHRIQPEVLAFVQSSVQAYSAQTGGGEPFSPPPNAQTDT